MDDSVANQGNGDAQDGVIELQPRILVDPSQAWFWSPEWQAGERRVDAGKAAGRFHEYGDADAMFAALDSPIST